jgi:aminoglycoside 6'-N-acetyltransferase I
MTTPAIIRVARSPDLESVTRLCVALWPDGPAAEHREHAGAILAGTPPSTLPLALFVAELEGEVVGFIEVGLRSHADGCDPRHPVGFIEGWYVQPAHRGRSLGRLLMTAAESWSRAQGATELASDTWIDHPDSQQAHAALGFEVVDRCVHFRKSLG